MTKRFVQVGAVVCCTYGSDAGKLGVIVEVVDHNRVLVDGPAITRQVVSFKRAALTDIVLEGIPRGISTGPLLKKVAAAKLDEKWAATSWAKKIQVRKIRQSLTDFDRFKVMVARKRLSTVVGKSVKGQKLRK